ncbi:hypothetical protein SNEBB_007211, partial [Seison nebaliae]
MLYVQLFGIIFVIIFFLIDGHKCIGEITFIPDEFQYNFNIRIPPDTNYEIQRKEIKNYKKDEIQHMMNIPDFPMKRIEDMADNFLGPNNTHTTYVAQNLEIHPVCTGKRIMTDMYYKNFEKTKDLGQGLQGFVSEFVNTENRSFSMVMKTYVFYGDLVMQLNAQYALNRLIPSFKLFGLLNSFDASELELMETGYMYDHRGAFCMMTDYVDGQEIGKNGMEGNLRNLNNNNKIRFIILLLRQLQVLHFSYNHYAILPRTPSFTDYTFTLYHGDLHSGNLIITPNGDPKLIDIGGPIWEG